MYLGSTARAAALALSLSALAAHADPEVAPAVFTEELTLEPAADDSVAVAEGVIRRDPTGAVTVIDVRARAAEAKDTPELLASAPGVQVQQSGGAGQRATLMVRGASSNGVRLLLDGLPLNGAGGIADLSLLPVAILDRLEVLRGGTGGTLGSGGLGGAVNAITRRIPRGARAFGELRYGSFDTAVGSAGLSGALLGGEGLLVLHGTRSDGDFSFLFDDQPANPDNRLVERTRRNNAAQQGGVLGKWTHRLGGWTTSALVEGLGYQRGLAGTSRNPTFEAGERGLRLTGAARLAGALWGGAVSARAYGRSERTQLWGGLHLSPLAQQFAAGGISLDGAWPLGRRQLLTATAEAELSSVEAAASAPAMGQLSVALADEVRLFEGRLKLVPAVRLERVSAARIPEGAAAVDHWLFSPKVGVAWSLPGGVELRANAGRTQRAPSLLELYVVQGSLLPNASLRPEQSLHADLGAAWRSEAFRASVTGFYGLYEDLIAYEYYPPFLARPRNVDRAAAGGAELEAAGDLPLGARLEASYTLTLSANLRDDPRFLGKPLPNRPLHHGALRGSAGPEWLRGRLEVDYRSAQALNRTGTLQLPQRWLINAGVSSRLPSRPELTASLELRNLLDVHTEDFDGYPLPGRSLHFTLQVAVEPLASETHP